jgi:Cu2+-exporting ATPase
MQHPDRDHPGISPNGDETKEHSHASAGAQPSAGEGHIHPQASPAPGQTSSHTHSEAMGFTEIARSRGEHAAHAHAHGAAVDHTGHEQLFRRRFWICLLLSIPVLLFSGELQALLGYTMPAFPGSAWIAPLFSVIVFAVGGVPFLQMAVPEIRSRQPGMMTLISLAIGVAFLYSMASVIFNLGSDFFWELVTLIDVMLLGHWLEMRSVRQASGALTELARLLPDTAERVSGQDQVEQVGVDELKPGDLVLVRPGASIPADGVVESGDSDVNESLITGESRPVKKAAGDRVIAGALNGSGSLRVRVAATGGDTALAKIMRLVEAAQQSKSRTQVLADRAAGWLFYAALGVAALTAIGWLLVTGFHVQVIERVVTVLVIACPHALGLAIPLVVALTTSLGARNGIIIRDRLALETARLIDVVVFDKTGTLTEGQQGVVGAAAARQVDPDRALALAAAVEGDSEHTTARAIREAAAKKRLSLPAAAGFEALKGRGVRAESGGAPVYAGGPGLLEMLHLSLPPELEGFTRTANDKGQTVVYLVETDRVTAAFALADVIRPESRPAVERLQKMGIAVVLLTGDSLPVAQAVAQDLGIDQVFAGVLPENKEEKIVGLQMLGKRVAMVGDGVNDAPALASADVGIAIGSGTDVAIETAGVILVKSSPIDVVKVIELSRASYRKMRQNLVWATGYNVVALPLAAGVLAPIGILLSPAVGALFMSVSTIIVALNAQLLRRVRL